MSEEIVKQYTATIRGVRPLIMHSSKMTDSLNPIVVEMSKLTSIKSADKKTEKVQWQIAKLEFTGSLYLGDEKKVPVVPVDNILRMIRDGAAAARRGKDMEAGVEILGDMDGGENSALQYTGPKDVEGLWDAHDKNGDWTYRFRKYAKPKGQGAVQRTRPRFPVGWAVTFTVGIPHYSNVDPQHVKDALDIAGRLKGLGDWRPRYGLFAVEKWGPVGGKKN